MAVLSAHKVFGPLFQGLSPRQRDILTRRFGLSGGESETLAALGEEYGVTRERIRQIEVSALEMLTRKIAANSLAGDLIGRVRKYLQSMGGVAHAEDLRAHCASFADGLKEGHLVLLAEAAEPFARYPEDEAFQRFFYLQKEDVKRASDFVSQFVKVLRGKRGEIFSGGFPNALREAVRRERMEEKAAKNYLRISKKFHTNSFGHTGLAEWPEINPRTIRDRIYLALKRHGAPLHFRAIADAINKSGITSRKALAPTVHNELIKDPRFVLVGRGIYGLAEHGYTPGTAKEVIKRILKREGPMALQDVVLAVQKERFFKHNTILANLQNRNLFIRTDSGSYRVREG
ncbi:MAG: hypothetical protein HY436_00870 [Candidatus Liptonbacteria bacterium]|nr:hypothetical protein [Candidatus Liptonbacteria bacterium]